MGTSDDLAHIPSVVAWSGHLYIMQTEFITVEEKTGALVLTCLQHWFIFSLNTLYYKEAVFTVKMLLFARYTGVDGINNISVDVDVSIPSQIHMIP